MKNRDYTDEEIIEALEKTGGIQTDAAALIGCNRKTIERRAKEVEAVQAAIDGGLDELADKSLSNIRQTVDFSEDEKIKIDTSKWVLARLRKGTWSERQELTGADGAELFQITFPVAGKDAESD